MKISSTTSVLARKFGDEKAIVMLAKAGFDAMDYSMFVHKAEDGVFTNKGFDKYAEKLKTVADAAGIEFGQLHAQMPSPSYPAYMENQKLWDMLAVNSIISAAIMNCPYVVIHPLIMLDRIYDQKYQENYDANLEYYGKMVPYLKEYGVKVAIENMWHHDFEKDVICPSVCSTSDEMKKLAKELGDGFVTCLDVGHCILTGETPEDMVYSLGDTLKVLHVHDNDGRDDNHDIPYNGFPTPMEFKGPERRINWDAFIKALKDINYTGTLSLEADSFLSRFPMELYEDASLFMAKVARHLADKFDK
ncbi:MAG: sugar phosphate isomerase/epimerase [Oscillospiraceae bacterium]|nr:sugar phosphate isomerase/epimerase [Oscillospiraceae bacterium]